MNRYPNLVALLLSCAPLPALADQWDFRDETVYFVMTDRYVDGDAGNNKVYGDEYVPGDLKYYQGGDFRGLITTWTISRLWGSPRSGLRRPSCSPRGAI
jgi:hypothetical protein